MPNNIHLVKIRLGTSGCDPDNEVTIDGVKIPATRISIDASPREMTRVTLEVVAESVELEGAYRSTKYGYMKSDGSPFDGPILEKFAPNPLDREKPIPQPTGE